MSWVPVKRINLSALRHNLAVARAHAPGRRVMAVVKADAYGHHLRTVATALENEVDGFGVARMGEGTRLRALVADKPVLVLGGAQDGDELRTAVENQLQLAIYSDEQLDMLAQAAPKRPLQCWLKVDTGMNRLGFSPGRAATALQRLQGLGHVQLVGLMTHLANADQLDDDYTERQLQCFASLSPPIELPRSIANSAGLLAWPDSHADWVRPGLMLYGISPFGQPQEQLRPVMNFTARIIAIRQLNAGDAVGYGGIWKAPESMRIGVVGAGYGDGYPREAAPGTPLLCRGRRLPLVGRVSMDTLTVDLRGLPDARVGDEILLWGEGLPVETIAKAAGTIPYTLCCGISERVQMDICA